LATSSNTPARGTRTTNEFANSGHASPTDGHRVGFADGTSTEVTTVVWATGFRRDHSWITMPDAFDDSGQLDHERGVTPVRGVYVLGQPWQHTTGSALLGFVQHGAAYIADHIDTYLAI
jgi:putative flavoprotein involved in K+ transport